MTSTTFEIEGFSIRQTLGLVFGLTARGRGLLPQMAGGLQQTLGGEIGVYQKLCEDCRAEALKRMLASAFTAGGNAVVGVRFDATEVLGGVTEFLCYGTAAIVDPVLSSIDERVADSS